ncbi:cytokine-dependent hematopoietic cell linker [Emydura macquarii macquarii]|uniref:cytokine-dependent hematopoietic cell linker n=1 Tax=Emydura macquarii macquarii TaxID=1129001 RepID=UPI00352B08AC
MNRSWSNINAASKWEINHREGKSRNIPEKTSNFDKHFAKVGQDESEPSCDVADEEQYLYDTVKTSSMEAMHVLKILPAKPIQESEYADKRYLGVSATTHISINSKSSITIQQKSSDYPQDLRKCRYVSEERRVPNVKDFNREVELSFRTQQQNPKYHPAPRLPCMRSIKGFQGAGSRLNIQNCSIERSPSPVKHNPSERRSEHVYVNLQTQHLTKPVEKDLNKYDWYIGEFDRQKAEEALIQENTDETFLVRDCSTKSSAEPYVLVIYYGKKVYNIKIRFLEDSQMYALGTGLRGDDKFDSVQEIIDFYKYVPITLIDGKDKSGVQREQCYLTHHFKFNRR